MLTPLPIHIIMLLTGRKTNWEWSGNKATQISLNFNYKINMAYSGKETVYIPLQSAFPDTHDGPVQMENK